MRYGRKCLVGNSDSLAQRESSRDYSCNYFICVLRKVMGYILGFSKELWLFIILGCKWKENKPFRNRKRRKRKSKKYVDFRLVIAVSGLRNLQLSNVCETFGILSVNVGKTFLAENALGHIYARWRTYGLHATVIYIYTTILEFNDKFKRFCEYIYLAIPVGDAI